MAHEGMRVIAAPQLDQPGHYIPATPTSSGQHYIPAFANGQFSVAPGSYQTIPQQYYQSTQGVQQATKTKSQPKHVNNSRNDLSSSEKYQQAAVARSNYYYKV